MSYLRHITRVQMHIVGPAFAFSSRRSPPLPTVPDSNPGTVTSIRNKLYLHKFIFETSLQATSTNMPRQGDGSSDNGPFKEAGHDILHGAGPNEVPKKLPRYTALLRSYNNRRLHRLLVPRKLHHSLNMEKVARLRG